MGGGRGAAAASPSPRGEGQGEGEATPATTARTPASTSRRALGQVLQRVTAHYADRGLVESVIATLAALNGQSAAAMPILDGLVSGWPRGKAPDISEAEKLTLSRLMQSLPEATRSRLLRLAKK